MELLGQPCVTPDCFGVIRSIRVFAKSSDSKKRAGSSKSKPVEPLQTPPPQLECAFQRTFPTRPSVTLSYRSDIRRTCVNDERGVLETHGQTPDAAAVSDNKPHILQYMSVVTMTVGHFPTQSLIG
jgi:hypothetical protein